jgi:CHAT domain-containing protein
VPLESIEREANARGYGHLLAIIHGTRAWFLTFRSRYPEALTESNAALTDYERLHDQEATLDARMRRIGVFRITGQTETAWSEALWCVRRASDMVEEQTRHIVFGEAAAAAVALGHEKIGLRYQNTAIALIRKALQEQPVKHFKVNLGIALRARAGIFARLGQYHLAANDIDEAIQQEVPGIDETVRRILQARLYEVRGQAEPNPARAIADFTNAFEKTSPEYRTYRAAILVERAKAERTLGRDREANDDLKASLAELHDEEKAILEHRERGNAEDLWSSYFSRFQETYRILIQQEIEQDHQPWEAFAHAERARAFETLDLILHLDAVPQAFRDLDIQRQLPRGVLLLEYCVLDDRTYTWIVSRDRKDVVRQAVPRRQIVRWSAELQRAARERNAGAFQRALYAPFEQLLAVPLARYGTTPKQLVIVPDGAMHGLPFAALRDLGTRHYLIQDMPVAIAGSARLYLFSLLRDHALASETKLLLIGDPAFDPKRGLPRLPRANDELQQIYAMYAPNAQIRVGAEATIPTFLDLARRSAIIHVVTHGIVDPRTPSHSALLFAPSDKSSGLLDAQALLTKLHLDRTRLVVLSACSSAGGLPVGPEGLAPLVRPLIAGGVPAVLGSLWDVDDATAAQLLVSFHRHYREGLDTAAALQAAQRDLLQSRNAGLRSALAWAPFQVIGYGSSPFKKKEKPP